MSGGSFEILINGIPRTYRDIKRLAVDAARVISRRELTSQITIIDRNAREWAFVTDLVAEPVWLAKPPAAPVSNGSGTGPAPGTHPSART